MDKAPSTIKLVVAVIIGAGVFLLFDILSSENWSLIVCKNSTDNLTCNSNRFIETDFKSLNSCRKAGNMLFKQMGIVYECGKNCEPLIDYPNDLSCNPLCDRVNCSN